MQVLYFGLFCDKEEESEVIENSNIGIQGAVISFQWNLIEGLIANVECPLCILNFLPVGTYPKYYKKILLKTVEWVHCFNSSIKTLGYINIVGVKQLIQFYRARVEIERWIKKTDDNNKCIVIYDIFFPYLIAVNSIKKKYPDIVTCSVVADLPNEYGYNKNEKGIKGFLRKIMGRVQMMEIKKIDCYALLTEQMKYPLSIHDKSYVVVEGIASSDVSFSEMEESGKKIILYAGVLTSVYGIDNLVNAFMRIDNDDYELWLCGSGDYQEQIRQCAEKDNRIKFFGYIPKKTVYMLQNRATVLVNPRQNVGSYTKYSFPSKIMEYLASGRPVVAYELDGVPKEYYNYIQCVGDNSIEKLRETILRVCELSFEERSRIGNEGMQFVMKNKNAKVQCKIILDLIRRSFH